MGTVSYTSKSVVDLLDAFASNHPVPGGGSAAALAGALGTSLLLMVAGLPKTRTGAPEDVADLAETAARLRPLRTLLVGLVDRDGAAYDAVMAAFKLPKGTDIEKEARRTAIQQAMREATEVPLETMRACRQALEAATVVAANGNLNAASDVGVAVELLGAGLRGARLNVDINLATLTDAGYVAGVRREADYLTAPTALNPSTEKDKFTG